MPVCNKCKKQLPEGAAFCPWCGRRQGPAPARKALKRANGMGTVYKLQERRKKPWAACRDKVLIGCYATKTEALEALERTQGQEINERYNATFDEVFTLWKAEHYRDLSPKGVEQYELAYKHCRELGPLKFRSIKLDRYQAIVDAMAAKGLSHSSCNKVKQLLGQMCKWAIREDIIHKNQAQFIRLPEEEKKEKEIFTDAEIRKLWSASADPAVQIILILLYTGMRVGELWGIEKKNVHLDAGYMVGGEKTEAGRNRIIAYKGTVAPFVESLYKAAPEGGMLIEGYRDYKGLEKKGIDAWRKSVYYKTLDRLGIPRKTPHTTRHTFATNMRKAGVRPEVLQTMLGHTDFATTANTYIHQDLAELQRAAALL